MCFPENDRRERRKGNKITLRWRDRHTEEFLGSKNGKLIHVLILLIHKDHNTALYIWTKHSALIDDQNHGENQT